MKRHLLLFFLLLCTMGISADKALEEWQILPLPNVICAEQFFLQTGAELEKNSDAWSGMTANAGGSPHSNIGFKWSHLDFLKDTRYKLVIRYKGNGWGGAYLIPKKEDAKRVSVSFSKDGGDGWKLTKAVPFEPLKYNTFIAYGDENLKFDCAWFFPENQDVTDEIPLKSWLDASSDIGWKTVNIPCVPDSVFYFGRVGCVLMKRNLDFDSSSSKKGTFFLKLGTPQEGQDVRAFLNGIPLAQVSGYVFAIPGSIIKTDVKNILSVQIISSPPGRCPWQQKGAVVKGAIEISDIHSFPFPEWARKKTGTNIIEKTAGKIRVILSMEKDREPDSLVKIKLLTVKDDTIELCLFPELVLGDVQIPLALDMASGEYFSWLGAEEAAGKELNLSVSDSGTNTSLQLYKFQDRSKTKQNHDLIKKGKLITGIYVTPVVSKASMEEKEKHYGKLFGELENAGINTLIINGISDSDELRLIKEKSLKYGIGIIIYPLNNGLKINYNDPEQIVPLFKQIVKEWGGFPNLTAYGIRDEISMEDARNWGFTRMIMEALDPRHPTTVILNMNHLRQTKILGAQILHRDIYYGSPGFLREVDGAQAIADALNIPLWVTVASGLPENELRLQMWLSIADGASGLFFFHGYASLYPAGSKYDGIFDRKNLEVRYQAKIIKDIFDRTAKLSYPVTSLKASENIVKSDNPKIEVRSRIAPDGGFYVFAVNLNTENEETASLVLSGDCEVTDCTDNTLVKVNADSSFRSSIIPGDAKIYRIIRKSR